MNQNILPFNTKAEKKCSIWYLRVFLKFLSLFFPGVNKIFFIISFQNFEELFKIPAVLRNFCLSTSLNMTELWITIKFKHWIDSTLHQHSLKFYLRWNKIKKDKKNWLLTAGKTITLYFAVFSLHHLLNTKCRYLSQVDQLLQRTNQQLIWGRAQACLNERDRWKNLLRSCLHCDGIALLN